MLDRPFAHMRVQADRLAVQRGCVYHGGVLLASAVGTATVAIYDGLDTGGELIDSFRATASDRDVHVFEVGVAIREGIYVDLGDNVSRFGLYYDPVPRELA